MLFRFFRQPAIDPLQVSMTGVRMGERFVLVGCDDAVLLAGLGAKVGLSGMAAAVVFDEHQAVRAQDRRRPRGLSDRSEDLARRLRSRSTTAASTWR